MPTILYVLGAVFLGLVIVWPLAFFGYEFYHDLVTAEDKQAHH